MKSFIIFLVSASVAYGTGIQINYYTDGGCDDYLASPPNVPTAGGCYQWQYTGTNSANVVGCSFQFGCECTFFTGPDCTGDSQGSTYVDGGSNCASDYGTGFQSFSCAGVGLGYRL
ncbi:hypothetical protein BX600DRAFT_519321 [Xylariales sp. PMI_506]|nr:hypothetical protein BX600DRAFT_519321 [Xylariales sp. PMI_506]